MSKTAITPTRTENYPQWYQQVIIAADLAENSPVRGCMVIKPWGYALWELIQQDLDRLSELSKESSNYLNRSFLEDRNLDWIPKIENMMKDKVVFVAVGAAHLAGQEGVIELLIKKGYHVLPIKL